ncbi:MAG: MFS transporter [Chloroflexi bacterium]|jgi:MFS family permease|nr:MFS transporter [Chloroflexota bacterium]MBT4074800.1 MFS transporter [Chloroflexota bacterium]MBT4515961.1 MFS transporter [Chloroflexota bacterium]MBT5320606.1 MFS transporter [Chloroflexota bacterium]MBT6682488.1 MFS transporter [Chloroflexota bacterium]
MNITLDVPTDHTAERRKTLAVVSLATLFGLSVWFSTNAVGPALETEKGFSTGDLAWLTIAVQLGFVAGTLIIAVTNLADLINARFVFGVSAAIAGLLNLGVIPLDDFNSVLSIRFATGIFLAGVYPPGMKIISGWFQSGRGIALGIMIGALTIGSGSPHLLRSAFVDNWEATIIGSSILSGVSAVLVVLLVRDGPYNVSGARFDPRYMLRAFTERGPRLTLFGYLGHMWELYAMWAWIGVFLGTVYGTKTITGTSFELASAVAFAAFLAGAIASYAAGAMAERWGRAYTTSLAMLISGASALVVGFLPVDWEWAIAVLVLVWGASVIADSAQFSTAMTELGEPAYRGTLLTFQTGLGFALTAISIRLVPIIEDASGWGWAFAILAIGPALGIAAMMRLRALPESINLAGGRR